MKRILSVLFVCFILTFCFVNVAGASPSSIESITPMELNHDQVLSLLKEAFPNSIFWGVEGGKFYVLPVVEIKKIMAEDDTDSLELSDSGDYVMTLVGNFSSSYPAVPIGFVKTPKMICNITIAYWLGEPHVFYLNPKTDQVRKVSIDDKVKVVIIF